MPVRKTKVDRTWPHCDPKVLHHPDDGCAICNEYAADLQEARIAWGINFTGRRDPGLYLCPAEKDRPIGTINKWGGNTPDGSGAGFYNRLEDSPTILTPMEISEAKAKLLRILEEIPE